MSNACPGGRVRWIVLSLSLSLVASCGGGGGGGGPSGAAPTPAHPQLIAVEFGRLVDVYGLRGQEIELFERDVLAAAELRDERGPGDDLRDDQVLYDFLSGDPDTLQPRLFIPREIDGPEFRRALLALDDHVRQVTPMAFGDGGRGQPFSVVPRNAAIRLRFSAPLGVDDSFFVERSAQGEVTGIRNADAVQLLQIAGDPRQPGGLRPLSARVVVRADNLILDPVLLGNEGIQYQTRNVAAGMPASSDQAGASIRIALPLEGPLRLHGLRADDLGTTTGLDNAGRRAVVRDFRAGNADDSSPHLARGFLRDALPPRLIGELPMYLERVDGGTGSQQVTVWKHGIVHDIDRGDVLRIVPAGGGTPLTTEVVADPEDDRAEPEVQHVRVRVRALAGLEALDPSNRPDYPTAPGELEPWLLQHAAHAILVAEFAAGGRIDPRTGRVVGDDPRYFITFSPAPLPEADGSASAANENVSPYAGAIVRFTKPVDLATVKWADTLFFGTRNLLDQEAIAQFVATRPWRLLSDGGQVVATGIGMDPGAFDPAKFRTPHLIGARLVDEDGSQTSLRLQPTHGFYLDAAMRQDGVRPYFLHLLGGSSGIRDLAGNPLDLQADGPERAGQVVIPFTLDTRVRQGRPNFDDNLAVYVVRTNAGADEDEQPSYYLAEEVLGASSPNANARAVSLPDMYGAFVLVDGQLQARGTSRLRRVADSFNQAPVINSGPLRWCPVQVNGAAALASNTSTTLFGRGIQNPLNPYGCRLQTVWRELDLSLSRADPFDFDLDVEQMYWAPFTGAQVTFDEFDHLLLQLGHSEKRPEPCVSDGGALASLPLSGLGLRFDDNYVRNLRANGGGAIESRPRPHDAYEGSPSLRIDPSESIREPTQHNSFLPLPRFRRPYFVFRDETVVEQGCAAGAGSDTNQPGIAPNLVPWLLSPWNNGLGRRSFQNGTGIGALTGCWNSCDNFQLANSGPDPFTEGLLGNIALPLLADFATVCDSAELPETNPYVAQGFNGWQVSVTVGSGATPFFRVLSAGHGATTTGRPSHCVAAGSDNWSLASGGFQPNSEVPTAAGDNTFYWVMIDFLKRASVATSGFVDLYNPHRVPPGFGDSRLGPYFVDAATGAVQLPDGVLPSFSYEFEPPLSQLPAGTTLVPEFRAAGAVDAMPWYWDEWCAQTTALLPPGTVVSAANLVAQLKPDAVNFPLDPFKAADAHIRKFDGRPGGRNWWTHLYNRTVTGYAPSPDRLLDATWLAQWVAPGDSFQPRDVRYVNWRYLMSNAVDAQPPVAPSIDTFALSYRFQRAH